MILPRITLVIKIMKIMEEDEDDDECLCKDDDDVQKDVGWQAV